MERGVSLFWPQSFASRVGFAWMLLWAILCSGCTGGNRSDTVNVTGAVTIDQQVLPDDADGTVTFMPNARGQAQPTNASIEQGRYAADDVPIGPVTVIFNITRLTGRMVVEDNAPGGTPFPEREDLVPMRCRQGLRVDVDATSETMDFDLQE